MKKKFILLLLILSLTACTNKQLDKKIIDDEKKEENTITEPVEPVYIDDNPIKLGLYKNGKLVTEYKDTFKDNYDIASFDVYFTNESDVGSTNTKYNFNKYYQNYENIDNYKIGFYVSFVSEDQKIEKNILSPKDMYTLSPYIFNYLYDDIHQPDGAWYSHVEQKDVNDNTIYSSIKLYATDKGHKISSPITLTVFTYDSTDDFDENGFYRGNSAYTVTIINNNQ